MQLAKFCKCLCVCVCMYLVGVVGVNAVPEMLLI